jgi:hypothetical protein
LFEWLLFQWGDSEPVGAHGSEALWDPHGWVRFSMASPAIFPRIIRMGFYVCCARNAWAGGVVIVYERKVKILFGKLLPLFFCMFFIP